MERILDPSGVTFNAAAGTLKFTTTVPLSLAHILRVVNLTRGEFYFDSTGSNGQGLTQSATYASPVLTLHYRIDDAADTDTLAVLYDDGSAGGGGSSGGGSGGGLAIPAADFAKLTYAGGNLSTVTYKTGGASGATVATLTLTYANGEIDTITITKP